MDYERFEVKLTLAELAELAEHNDTVETKYHQVLEDYENIIVNEIVSKIDSRTFDLLSDYLDTTNEHGNFDTSDFFDKLKDAVWEKDRKTSGLRK
jgi:hypothetical protein